MLIRMLTRVFRVRYSFGTGYLCSLSSVQDKRKEIDKLLPLSFSKTKNDYLNSMAEYGDYWYQNLTSYTEDTYKYVMRMASI